MSRVTFEAPNLYHVQLTCAGVRIVLTLRRVPATPCLDAYYTLEGIRCPDPAEDISQLIDPKLAATLHNAALDLIEDEATA